MANDLVLLNQNYGLPLALQITQVTQPDAYVLEVFQSSDWDNGNTDDAYAVGSSQLDASGNWLTPVPVSPGTYNVIIRKPGVLVICYFSLAVSGAGGVGGAGSGGGLDFNESVLVNGVGVSDDYLYFVNRPKPILVNGA